MACNVPVVSTAVGDVRERLDGVEPSGVGNSEDELAKLLSSTLESNRRSNGREAAEEVSWGQIGNQLTTIYTSIL